ncbi:MAG: ABC transporter substrate-binding protein [Gammaproteobacteria bacterium]|nr:ABC transporter substrate-binding protein [Gammaproteobacteria bacterium]
MRSIIKSSIIFLCMSLFTMLPAHATETKTYTLKFATLAPSGTTWMNLLEEWAAEVKEKTHGQIIFKFYPGGVQGDEPDVLRKIRFGQLQGAAFSGYGIGNIYSPARIMEIPFLFDDHAEIDMVRHHFMPDFERGFRKNGYELLGWMEIGFVRFFSKEPIYNMDDLKNRRIWLWQGDRLGEAFFKASGLAPVPLSIIDVFTSLSTGLLDTVYSTPLASIAMQWYTKTKYVTNVPMLNAMGAIVVSNRFFNKLPTDLQKILKDSGKIIGERLIKATRIDNETSIDILKQEGLKFVLDPEDIDKQAMIEIRDNAAKELIKDNYLPQSFFDTTRVLLKHHREMTANNPGMP